MNSRRPSLNDKSSCNPSGSIKTMILATADDLFYREGIRAVGVDRLSAVAGVAKATLYQHFGTKEKVVLAYLEARHNKVLDSLTPLPNSADVYARIGHVFDLLEEKAVNPEFRGCAFLLAASEHPNVAPIIAMASRHKRAIRDHLLTLLHEHMADRHECAVQIALLYDGALASLTIHRDPAAISAARDAAMRLVASYLR